MQPSVGEATTQLLVTSRALVAVAARSLAGDDEVTLPQWRALVVLASHPATTVSDLAEALAIHPSTATRLCDRLVAKRLVRRSARPSDRRATELRLTAAGRRLVDRVTDRRRRDIAAVVEQLPAAKRRRIVEALGDFNAAAGEPVGADLLGWAPPPAPEP